ncbi:MAG: PDZ domain-containing protein [Gemmataceae bacterium]
MRRSPYLAAGLAIILLQGAGRAWAEDDLDSLREQAIKAATRKIAPSVVQIETSGGLDVIRPAGPPMGPRGGGAVRKGAGPTTGLVVAKDGYIITSSFNFANKPAAIFVAVPGHKERYVGKIVGTDHSRMLTLIKIDANNLPEPPYVPKAEMKVGQTSLALGRTLTPNLDQPPSVSEGIISAVGRIWGKALQTDAKVSPGNYGGPMVDLEGRVQGVLVPLSPNGEGETAGIEWYDSGIGFAIPLEDIFAVLPRLREGKDLKKGLLGVTVQNPDIYSVPPTISAVAPESAAQKAGIKAGDVIKEINGHAVANQAQVMHQLGALYEGDLINVKILRGKEEKIFSNLKLSGALTAFHQAFLGILPMRDDPELGVEVRFIYPKSPAEAAGIKAGDRIMKFGGTSGALQAFSGRDAFMTFMNTVVPGMEVKLEVAHKENKKTETLTVRLSEVPDAVPDKLPEPASYQKALAPRKTVAPAPKTPMKTDKKKDEKKDSAKDGKKEEKKEEAKDDKKDDKKKFETGLLKRTNTAKDHEYWVYVPANYDPNIAHALVVWLHPINKNKQKDIEEFTDFWSIPCEDQHLIIVGPKAENETGWLPSESDFIQETINNVAGEYTVDRRRIVAHGMGVGGQMAYYLGFHNRDSIRAVAATGAALSNQPKEKVSNQPLAFYIHVGGKDPVARAVGDTKAKLLDHKFPVIFREAEDKGHQYLEGKLFDELMRWIDSLDML